MDAHNKSSTPTELKDLWETPTEVYDRICQVTNLTPRVDVCATGYNRKCRYWYGLDLGLNSLEIAWFWGQKQVGVIPVGWMNPPYSALGAWCAKAAQEAAKGAIIIGLVPHAPDTQWFQEHVEGAASTVYLPDGRINFIEPGRGLKTGNPKPSCVPVWTPWGNDGQPTYRRYKRNAD